MGSLQYVLERGQEDDWFASKTIVILTATSILSFFFFLWRELTYDNPIVELRVLKNANLRIGTIMSFIMGFGLYGSTFIIPLYTQSVLGWTALQAGELMIPAALVTAFTMPIIGNILQKGAKPQILAAGGLVLFAFFCYQGYRILTPDTGKDAFFWMLMLRGFGMGMLFIPITSLSLSSLKGQQIGQGAAFTGMMRQLGGSFGVALITTYMARQNWKHFMDMSANVTATNPLAINRVNGATANYIAHGMTPDVAQRAAYTGLQGAVMRQAQVMSYMDVFLALAIIFIAVVPLILFIRQKKKKPGEATEKVDMSAAH